MAVVAGSKASHAEDAEAADTSKVSTACRGGIIPAGGISAFSAAGRFGAYNGADQRAKGDVVVANSAEAALEATAWVDAKSEQLEAAIERRDRGAVLAKINTEVRERTSNLAIYSAGLKEMLNDRDDAAAGMIMKFWKLSALPNPAAWGWRKAWTMQHPADLPEDAWALMLVLAESHMPDLAADWRKAITTAQRDLSQVKAAAAQLHEAVASIENLQSRLQQLVAERVSKRTARRQNQTKKPDQDDERKAAAAAEALLQEEDADKAACQRRQQRAHKKKMSKNAKALRCDEKGAEVELAPAGVL